MRRVRLLSVLALATVAGVVAAGCSGASNSGTGGDPMRIVVSAPVSSSPWIAEFEQRGADLAAAELNNDGGVDYGGHKHQVVVSVRDNAGSPQQVVADARTAVDQHAAALIIDGVGAA